MNLFKTVGFLLGCMLLAGCVSTVEKAPSELPKLLIAQNSDGDVTLEWQSDPAYVYTVFYQARPDAEWIGVEGAIRVAGTGERLTAYHKVNPDGPLPRYRIFPEKQP